MWCINVETKTFHNCDVKRGALHMMSILSLTFYYVRTLTLQMTPYSLKLVNTIYCYNWNSAGSSYCFLYFFAACFHLFLENISAKVTLLTCCILIIFLYFYDKRNNKLNTQWLAVSQTVKTASFLYIAILVSWYFEKLYTKDFW